MSARSATLVAVAFAIIELVIGTADCSGSEIDKNGRIKRWWFLPKCVRTRYMRDLRELLKGDAIDRSKDWMRDPKMWGYRETKHMRRLGHGRQR